MKRLLLLLAILSSMAFGQGGTTSSDIYPATTGQNIGNPSKRWNLYTQNINITGTFNCTGTGCPTGGGAAGSPPDLSVQVYNASTSGLTSDPNVTINTTTHKLTSPLLDTSSSNTWSQSQTFSAGSNLTAQIIDCPPILTISACYSTASAYAGSNESGSGKGVFLRLYDATYTTGGTITLNSGVSIVGVGPRTTYVAGQAPDFTLVPNGGTWIDCGASQCFTGSGLRGVTIKDVGFKNFTNVATFGSNGVDGISFSTIQNVYLYGNSVCCSSDSGFVLYNWQHVRVDHVQGIYMNTLLNLINQSNAVSYGNANFSDVYVYTYAKSAANGNAAKPGIWLQNLAPTSGQGLGLNNIQFDHLQVNSYSGDGTGYGIIAQGLSGAGGQITGLIVTGLDIEGTLQYGFWADYLTESSLNVARTTPSITTDLVLTSNSTANVAYSETPGSNFTSGDKSNMFFGIWTTAAAATANNAFPLLGYDYTLGKSEVQAEQLNVYRWDTSAPVINMAAKKVADATHNTYGGEIDFGGAYWDGAATAVDQWRIRQGFTSTSTNPASGLYIEKPSGSSGTATFNIGSGIALALPGATVTSGGVWNVTGGGDISSGTMIFDSTPIVRNNSAATVGSNPAGTKLYFYDNIWNGASALNQTYLQWNCVASGVNPNCYLKYGQDSGTTGWIGFSAPNYLFGSKMFASSTAPTVSSGFGTSPSIPNNNGTVAFTVNVGTGGVATSGVVGLPTATTGWICSCNDITTFSTTVFACRQTASSTTSATLGEFNNSAVASAWAASDILNVSCSGY